MVEGESSLTAHSVFANDLLQKVVNRDSLPEMRERIDALRHIVDSLKKQPAADEMRYPHARPVRPVAVEGCELPPIDKTLQVLKLAKCLCMCWFYSRAFVNDRIAHKQVALAWVFDVYNMEDFPTTCLAVYMADDYNAVHFITVNVALHYLFWAFGNLLPDRKEEYIGYSRICGVNIETALSSLPLHLPANDDVIVALSLGVRARCFRRNRFPAG